MVFSAAHGQHAELRREIWRLSYQWTPPHIAGPEGCTTFEIFSNHRGSYVTLVDTPQGRIECDVSTREGMKKMEQAMLRDMEANGQA